MSNRFVMNGHWCRALATLLMSGIDTYSAMTALKNQANNAPKLQNACQLALLALEQGASLTQAMANHGFFSRYQLEQLRVAELSGTVPAMLASLATRLEKTQERQQRLNAQLKLSQAVIVIALLAGSILALVRHQSLWPILVQLLIIIFMTKALFKLLSTDIFVLLAALWSSPIFLKFSVTKQFFEYYWFSLWWLQSSAGIDNAQIMANLRELLPSAHYRHQCRLAQRYIEEGNSLLTSLSQERFIGRSALKQVILVGEKSGRLHDNIKHHLNLESQHIDLIINSFYEWLPRFYYVIALGVVLKVLV